ncbi:MAG: alpha-2-macroglobulin family protein [Arenicella sp.]
MKRITLLGLALVLSGMLVWLNQTYVATASANNAQQPAKPVKPLFIESVTPSGEDVPAARQIVIRFNRAVVPLGRMQRSAEELGITVSPALNCQWRWLDTQALACQLGDTDHLKPATRYVLNIADQITAEDGTRLSKRREYQFVTQRPRLSWQNFMDWRAPGVPVVQLYFNQEVSRRSVARHVYLHNKTMGREALKVVPVERVQNTVNPLKSPAIEPDVKPETELFRSVWVVMPEKELPLDTAFDLRLEPGLISQHGSAEGVEDKSIIEFHTFPEFEFLGMRCSSIKNESITLSKPGDASGKCNPMQPVSLEFSTPVLRSQVKKLTFVPELSQEGGYAFYNQQHDYSQLHQVNQRKKRYATVIPGLLQAVQSHDIVQAEGVQIKDEFGRILPVPIDFRVASDHRPPLFYLPHNMAVLEALNDADKQSDMAVLTTNIQQARVDYRTLTLNTQNETDKRGDWLNFDLNAPGQTDSLVHLPLQIRSLLNANSGIVYGHLTSEPSINNHKQNFMAQVTPYQVHVKLGHHNTLVWVTDLATGESVANADVSIFLDKISALNPELPALAKARTDASGIAVLPGSKELDPQLQASRYGWHCNNDTDCKKLLVHVEAKGQMALLPLLHEYQVNGSFWSQNQPEYGHMGVWGTTAQGVYRAGSPIQYKLYVRDEDNLGHIPAPRESYTLRITDPTGKLVDEQTRLTLSEYGTIAGEYSVPDSGAAGWYNFVLSANFAQHWEQFVMSVLVSDFTPAPFKVENEVAGERFFVGDSVSVNSKANLHSGGPYANAPIRLTASVVQQTFQSKHPEAKAFQFTTGHAVHHDYHNFNHNHNLNQQQVFQESLMIDASGQLEQTFELPATGIVYGDLNIESAVQDDRGKFIAAQTNAEYFSVDRLVGLKNTKWLYQQGETAEVEHIVVDASGTPMSGSVVNIKVERHETVVKKIKVENGFRTEHSSRWLVVAECQTVSVDTAQACGFVPDKPGSYKISAETKDTLQRLHRSEISAWVIGKGRVLWEQPEDNSLSILPEQEEYTPGETARYLVKNPYPGAQALVSLERHGVIKHWVQTLDSSTALIEFEVEEAFAPGFYLSVVVMSPRVAMNNLDGEKLNASDKNNDPGKPAFKSGMVKVPVTSSRSELNVQITTNKAVYKPRETVETMIKVTDINDKRINEPVELAVVVLDEAVLDLVQGGEAYFDVHKGFNQLESIDVNNYSLLQQLLGREFEKVEQERLRKNKSERVASKVGAASVSEPQAVLEEMESADFALADSDQSQAEGDANITVRSLINYVSYWNPSIEVDKQGKVELEFELPDNLTGWRILVLAVTSGDKMAMASEEFKTNQETVITPVLPNQVTEGDSFDAGFSVMNRSDQQRQITVTIQTEGDFVEREAFSQTVILQAYERQTVFMPIQSSYVAVPETQGNIQFTVQASDLIDGDAIRHSLPVLKRRSLVVAADYGSTTENQVSQSILIPEQIYGDIGDVSVNLSPSVIGNVEGAFGYMRDYPYICWEQKLSKAVMASHYQNLQAYMPDSFSWKASEKLPQKTLDDASNHQAPNGGMSYFTAKDEYTSPYLSAYTALAFQWLRNSGYQVSNDVEDKLHRFLQQMLLQESISSVYNKGMNATVRAVALAALAQSDKLDRQDLHRHWQKYQQLLPDMSLFGQAQLLQAAIAVGADDDMIGALRDSIMAHSNQSAGKISFDETLNEPYARILSTPMRSNCSVLSSLVSLEQRNARNGEAGESALSELPFKLVRSITQSRGKRDRWENTQENIFCLNGLIDYARVYESESPDMVVEAMLADQSLGSIDFSDVRDSAQTLSRPLSANDAGKKQALNLSRKGQGRLYYVTKLSYATKGEDNKRINAGIDIRRQYSVQRNNDWVLLDETNVMNIKRGELVRVDLYLSLPTARNFVVVDDSVPGGLEPVNRDLANASLVDAEQGKFKAADGAWWFKFRDWHGYGFSRWSFHHQELLHNAARFYSDYLPAGNYHLSYTAQAVATGTFTVNPVHAQEMYDDDIFGKGVTGQLEITQ